MSTPAQQGGRAVGADYDVTRGMVIFFLIFLIISVVVETIAGAPTIDGFDAAWHPMVLVHLVVASAAAAIIYGIIISLVGKRLPGTWLGEAILVALIFYGIWIVLQLVSEWGLTGTYLVRGLIYTVICGVVAAIIYAIIDRAHQRA